MGYDLRDEKGLQFWCNQFIIEKRRCKEDQGQGFSKAYSAAQQRAAKKASDAEAKKAVVPEEVRHAIELVGLGWKGCVGACNSEL